MYNHHIVPGYSKLDFTVCIQKCAQYKIDVVVIVDVVEFAHYD